MASSNSTTLRTAGVHPYKFNTTNAHRVLRMMNDPATPPATRRALRDNLKRLASCTDIDKRNIFRVESVAVLLRIGLVRQPGATWRRANAAHVRLWQAFNAYDRQINPRRWRLFDKVTAAYRRKIARQERERARRAARKVAPRPAPRAVRVSA